jgi:hypothetical protein
MCRYIRISEEYYGSEGVEKYLDTQMTWTQFLWNPSFHIYLIPLAPLHSDICIFTGIFTCKSVHFAIKNPNFEFYKLKCGGSNFQRYSDMIACMTHWVWYFRRCRSTVVIKLANRVFGLIYFLIWNRIGIFAWIQFLCVNIWDLFKCSSHYCYYKTLRKLTTRYF